MFSVVDIKCKNIYPKCNVAEMLIDLLLEIYVTVYDPQERA
jgi:hypothetical protein